jgi:hypothetical protein
MDMEVIYNIPLLTRRQADFWAWHFDHKGLFTIRLSYLMFLLIRERANAWFEGRPG